MIICLDGSKHCKFYVKLNSNYHLEFVFIFTLKDLSTFTKLDLQCLVYKSIKSLKFTRGTATTNKISDLYSSLAVT